jgi:hypothetical protein
MFIDIVPNRNSPPAVLLRESWREGKKTFKRTVANLSSLPPEAVDVLRRALKGETLVSASEAVEIERTLPHGHVAAVLGTLRRVGLDSVLASRPCRERDLVLAMLVARIIDPLSKLATARGLDEESAFTSLAETLGVTSAGADELYAAMDWLLERQERIEAKLARRHLRDGTLVLYDVSSTYFEGRHCPLAAFGHNRDRKKGKRQIVFGLLTTVEGCPVAVEVFPGNTSDQRTLGSAIEKLRERFGLARVVMVADRGMLTEARIDEEVRPAGLDWITALRTEQIRGLVESGALQLSLFDLQDLGEINSPDFPGERLIACKNPLLEEERARKREALLRSTEAELEKLVQATRRERRPLRGKAEIGVRLGRVLGRFKVGKHFRYEITDGSFCFERDEESIRREAALDGLYVIRTSVRSEILGAEQAVDAYKGLARVERAFRSQKTVDLEVRPIHHRRESRVRAHVFLCMLAYHVEWHMRQALAPILFDDHDPAGGRAKRTSPVAPAERSDAAKRKAQRGRTEDGLPVHSFRTLLRDLATLAKNRVRLGDAAVDQLTRPTPLQRRAFELLKVKV